MKQCKVIRIEDGTRIEERERIINSWLATGYEIKGVQSLGYTTYIYLEKTV